MLLFCSPVIPNLHKIPVPPYGCGFTFKEWDICPYLARLAQPHSCRRPQEADTAGTGTSARTGRAYWSPCSGRRGTGRYEGTQVNTQTRHSCAHTHTQRYEYLEKERGKLSPAARDTSGVKIQLTCVGKMQRAPSPFP